MITKNATACLIAGAALALGIAGGIGPPAATTTAVAQKSRPAASLNVSGTRGSYLEFAGVERAFGTYAGRLKFKRPVTSGKYRLSVTFTSRTGKKSRVVYDVTARQR